MTSAPPAEAVLIRHGETTWSRSGRHTGTTDLPLTGNGRRAAQELAPHLASMPFSLVLCSPLQRARQTCELAGLGEAAQLEPDLREWDYGEYEGLTHAQIDAVAPGWLVFRDGCPGGETPAQVTERVDRVIARVRAMEGRVALFAHGHLLRLLAARWIGLEAAQGARFLLDTATISLLSYYQGIPALKRWNAPLSP